jgi:hypothetical protein
MATAPASFQCFLIWETCRHGATAQAGEESVKDVGNRPTLVVGGGGEFDQLKSGRGLSPLGLALSAGVVA